MRQRPRGLRCTSFFPRWWMEDEAEINSFFEREMPAPATRPLFEAAKSLGIGFHLGYAEPAQQNGVAHRYNTAILSRRQISQGASARPRRRPAALSVSASGETLFRAGRFGLSGVARLRRQRRHVHLQRSPLAGDLSRHGNAKSRADVLGCNTLTHLPWVPVYDHLADFHNHLCMQAGAYQNSTWVVGIAKSGNEEGSELLAEARGLHRPARNRLP